MPRMVDVGIQIRAFDNTRRAINSVRRGFRMLRSDFTSLRSPRMTGMSSSLRDIRRQIMSTAGITRGWMTSMIRGSQVMASQTMPRIRQSIKRTSDQAAKSTDRIRMGFKGINMTMSSSLLSMGLFSTSVFMLGKRMVQATLDMDKYVRGFKVLDGGVEAARMTMQEIIEVSKLPGIQIPQASESYMNLRSVGITNRFGLRILEEFSNAVAIAGGRAIDLREAIRQLGQTISIQKFDMENWRVMLERIPTIRLAVQKAFGPQAIHTEELTKVLEHEGMSVNQAWTKIIDSMMLQERADPDTITNAVERLQNTLWHMSANIGEIYAPTIQNMLKTLNMLVEGFNELSKPVREFIAFMGTGAFSAVGFGLAIFGVAKIVTGLINAIKGFKGVYAGFMDAPAFGQQGFFGKRYADAYGVAPDITRRQLSRTYRKGKGIGSMFAGAGGFGGVWSRWKSAGEGYIDTMRRAESGKAGGKGILLGGGLGIISPEFISAFDFEDDADIKEMRGRVRDRLGIKRIQRSIKDRVLDFVQPDRIPMRDIEKRLASHYVAASAPGMEDRRKAMINVLASDDLLSAEAKRQQNVRDKGFLRGANLWTMLIPDETRNVFTGMGGIGVRGRHAWAGGGLLFDPEEMIKRGAGLREDPTLMAMQIDNTFKQAITDTLRGDPILGGREVVGIRSGAVELGEFENERAIRKAVLQTMMDKAKMGDDDLFDRMYRDRGGIPLQDYGIEGVLDTDKFNEIVKKSQERAKALAADYTTYGDEALKRLDVIRRSPLFTKGDYEIIMKDRLGLESMKGMVGLKKFQDWDEQYAEHMRFIDPEDDYPRQVHPVIESKFEEGLLAQRYESREKLLSSQRAKMREVNDMIKGFKNQDEALKAVQADILEDDFYADDFDDEDIIEKDRMLLDKRIKELEAYKKDLNKMHKAERDIFDELGKDDRLRGRRAEIMLGGGFGAISPEMMGLQRPAFTLDDRVDQLNAELARDLQKLDEQWGQRHVRTQRRLETARAEGAPEAEIIALDERLRNQHQAYTRHRKMFIDSRKAEIDEIKGMGSERELLRLEREHAEARGVFDTIRTGGKDILLQQERSIRHAAETDLRDSIRRAQEERRILETYADPETDKVPEGIQVTPQEIERNLAADRRLRAQVANELHLFDTEMDSNIARRESALEKSRKDLEVAKSQGKIDSDKLDAIRSRIEQLQREKQLALDMGKTGQVTALQKHIEAERAKLKDLKLPDVDLLENNIKQMETQLEQYRRHKEVARKEMLGTHEERLRDVERRDQLADEELKQATRRGPRGTIFADEGLEADIRQTVDAENRRAGKRFKEAGDRVKQTETLKQKALANWKAINHIGVLTEVGYGLAIGAGLSAITFAASAIVQHFQQLEDTTNRFDTMMQKHLPTVVKWTRQYDDWRKALRSLRGEYDVVTPQMQTAFKSELEFLENLSRSNIGITDRQSERMQKLNKILKEGRIALDEYGIAFYQNLVKTGASELTKHQYVQEAYAEFGEQLKTIDKAMNNLDADQLLQYFGPSGLDTILDLRERQIKELDETLKKHDVIEVNLGGVKTKVEPQSDIGLSISRFFAAQDQKTELRRYMEQLALDDTPLGALTRMPIKDMMRIFDLQLQRRQIQRQQDQFTQGYEQARSYTNEVLANIPDFMPTDLKEWTFALTDARDRLEQLRNTLLTMPTPIQDFHKATMQYYTSIVSAEDKALKRVETLTEKYHKAQTILDVETFVDENRKLLKEGAIGRSDVGIMQILGFKLGEEERKPEFLDEFNRLIDAIGGDRNVPQMLKRVTGATVHARRQELEAIEEEIQTEIREGRESINELKRDRLQELQRSAQDFQATDIGEGRYLGIRIGGQENYIKMLERSLGLETDPLKQDSLQRAIQAANSQLEELKKTMIVREATFKEISLLQENEVKTIRRIAAPAGAGFDLMLKQILGHEGGLDTRDTRKGGLSYAGITQSTYNEWLKTLEDTAGVPMDVEYLGPRADVVEDFYRWYFKKYQTHEMPAFIQSMYADMAVNAGSRALKIVQGMLGVDENGKWNEATQKAVQQWINTVKPEDHEKWLRKFDEGKRAHYGRLKTLGGPKGQPTYWADSYQGWINRADDVLARELAGRGDFIGQTTATETITVGESSPFGYSDEQSYRRGKMMLATTQRYSSDVAKIASLYQRIRDIDPFSDRKLDLSGDALENIRQSLSKITGETIRWNMVVQNTGDMIRGLRSQMLSAPSELRDSVRGEISFLQGLSGTDFEAINKLLTDYHSTYSDLQRLMSAGRDDDNLVKQLEHITKNVPSLGDYPFFSDTFSNALGILKDRVKAVKDGDIGELQRQLHSLQKQLDEKIRGDDKDKILGYLSSLKTSMIDIYTGVPPTLRISQLREELERLGRTTEGTEQSRVSRRIEIEKEIQQQQTQVDLYRNAQQQIAKYLPYLGKEGGLLNLTASALAKMNALQKEAIDNYKALEDAKRKDAIQSVIEGELLKKQEKTEQSKAIERINRVGVRSMNNKYLSMQEREEQLVSGSFGDNAFSGRISSSEYRSFMDAGSRALNELDVLEGYYRQYYSDDPAARQAYREQVAKQIVEKTGEAVDPAMLDRFIEGVDQVRRDAGNAVIEAIINRRGNIEASMQEAGSLANVFINDLYKAMSEQASRLYDQTYEAIWGVLVTGPRDDARAEEDRQLRKSRQIEDIQEMRREREISSREMRQRLKDLEKDYQKESLRLEEDALIQRKRMWEDFFTSITKGFADVVAETVKARAGAAAGNWIADLLGIPQIPGQQQIMPQGGFWSSPGDTITKDAAGKLGKSAIEGLWNQLTGGGAGAGVTEGLKQESIISKYILSPEEAGTLAQAGGGWKAGLTKAGVYAPHALAGRMALGTIIDGFNPDRNTKPDDYIMKNPFNRFIHDIFGISFDNPENDKFGGKVGFKRANRIAKMLGTNTPKDLVRNYDAAVMEGFDELNRRSGDSNSDESKSGKMFADAMNEQTERIVEAIAEHGGTNIGDPEVRKALKRGRAAQRDHRSATHV